MAHATALPTRGAHRPCVFLCFFLFCCFFLLFVFFCFLLLCVVFFFVVGLSQAFEGPVPRAGLSQAF